MATYSPLLAVINNPNVFQKKFQDIISTKQVLVWWLSGKPVDGGAGLKPKAQKFTMEIDGGSRFEVPLMLYTNTNMKAFAKDAEFSLDTNDIGDRAYYDVKSIGGPIPIYGLDEDASRGSANLLPLVESFIAQATNTMTNLLGTQFTRSSAIGADDWQSLFDLVAEDPTADSIGGISAATFDKWRNIYYDATSRSIATYLLADLTKYRIDSTLGTQRPRIILCSTDVYGAIVGKLVANQRYVPDAQLVEAGFEGIQWEGASVMFEPLLPAGTVFGLNPESLVYGTLKGATMKMEEFVRVPNADMKVAMMVHRGNLMIKDRRTNFQLFNYTTA